jgi:hypothetical protein
MFTMVLLFALLFVLVYVFVGCNNLRPQSAGRS